MEKRKARLTVDESKCAPCVGLVCVGVCPEGILEPGKDKRPRLADETQCTACGVCVNLCSTKAITLQKGDEDKDKPR